MKKHRMLVFFICLFHIVTVSLCVAGDTKQKNKVRNSKIIGEWLSTSITNSIPLFKNNPQNEGMLKLTFEKNNEVEWVLYDLKEEKNIEIHSYYKGKYEIKNNKLILAPETEEEYICNFILKNNELEIDTKDEFQFKLKRIN